MRLRKINGVRLSEIRLTQGMMDDQLSKDAGLSISEIKRIERATSVTIRDDTFLKIATALGIPAGQLLEAVKINHTGVADGA